MELKKNLRKKILLDRKKFSKVDHLKENDIIVKNISDFLHSKVSEKDYSPEKKLKLITGLYCPMLGEPNLLKLVVSPKWTVVIPKIRGEEMDFVKYEVGSHLETIMSGKLKQPGNNIKLVPNIAILPGLAFSLSVDRLGFGAGYYDKYFAKTGSKITKIGVCFHENLYECLPREAHDTKMDYIITDKTIISFNQN
jgi:5-formyltetrahydrofolate cyclo-ligase